MTASDTAGLRSLQSLEQVLDWSRRHGLDLSQLDVITQDEFSHDVLIPLGASGGWAAFGVT